MILRDLSKIVENIKDREHSMDVNNYIRNKFPLEFPNRGLGRVAKKGLEVHLFHEAVSKSVLLSELNEDAETFIDYTGSSGQRNYIYHVNGSRFSSNQKVYFRGILGRNRLEKISLMLLFSGIRHDNIIVHDEHPDYAKLIQKDLENIHNEHIDTIVIGGKIVFGDFLKEFSNKIISFRGEIISGDVYQHKEKINLYTTFPYGDLCQYVVEGLQGINFLNIFFVGSCGYLKEDMEIGQLLTPKEVINFDGMQLIQKHQNILNINGKKRHGVVICPLYETMDFIEDLKQKNINSIDTDVAYFQKSVEGISSDIDSGILLYISDTPGRENTFDSSDYYSKILLNSRRRVFEVIQEWIMNH